MAVPFKVRFDRYAQASSGLVAVGLGFPVAANGIALVTGWLFGENWNSCFDPVATSWTLCAAETTTTWDDNNPNVTTTWEFVR